MEVIKQPGREDKQGSEQTLAKQRSEDPNVLEPCRNGDEATGGGSGAVHRLEMQPSRLPWAKVAAEKSLTAKGSSLKFVALSMKEGTMVAKLDKDEVNHLAEVWSAALIVYVVGHTPSIGMILRHIEKEWNSVAKP